MKAVRWHVCVAIGCGLTLSACLDPFPEDPGASGATPVSPLPDNTVPGNGGPHTMATTSTSTVVTSGGVIGDGNTQPAGSTSAAPIAPSGTASGEPSRDPSDGPLADASISPVDTVEPDAGSNDASPYDAGPDADADALEPHFDGGRE